MRIIHVINSLEIGGAEMMLLKLLKSKVFLRDQILVVVLTKHSKLTERIQKLGFEVKHLNFCKSPLVIFEILKLYKIIKIFAPNIVHSWLYQADLISGIISYWLKIDGVVWSVRQSSLEFKHNKITTLLCAKLCALLSSRIATKITVNSKEAIKNHIKIGYDKNKICLVHNGFELNTFKKFKVKEKNKVIGLNIEINYPIVGFIGRYDIQKNHKGFLQAAKLVVENNQNVKFFLVGRNVTEKNNELSNLKNKFALNENVFFLGEREDIPVLMNIFDIFVLPSDGESFPNVIGEAMACELPCVVTNVGETMDIIGKTGKVVSKGDMASLAKEIISLINLNTKQREKIGLDARNRIKNNFDIKIISKDFQNIYKQIFKEKNVRNCRIYR